MLFTGSFKLEDGDKESFDLFKEVVGDLITVESIGRTTIYGTCKVKNINFLYLKHFVIQKKFSKYSIRSEWTGPGVYMEFFKGNKR